jgi:integrase
MRRRKAARVLGPYAHGRQWRIIVVDERGERDSRLYPERRLAEQVIRSVSLDLGLLANSITIEEALILYKRHLLEEKENKQGSVTTTLHRLRSFFTEPSRYLNDLDHSACKSYYEKIRTSTKTDTHRNTLSEARTFIRFCLKHGHIREDVVARVEPVGKRNKGKPQLRLDEGRRWMRVALERAEREPSAIAAMMALLMGLRATEIVTRVVRDVDNEGTILWVSGPGAKTDAGRRMVAIPALLREPIARLIANRPPTALVFGKHWRDWVRKAVGRICLAAGVPSVSAHAMRGAHSTFALEIGVSAHEVARALGHASETVTFNHYVAVGTKESVRGRATLRALKGGIE